MKTLALSFAILISVSSLAADEKLAQRQVAAEDQIQELQSDAREIQNQAPLPYEEQEIQSAAALERIKPAPKFNPEDKSCICNLATEGENKTIEFEDYKTCDPRRNYLKPIIESFAKADPTNSYVKSRSASENAHAEVPRKCVTFVMRSFLETLSQKNPFDSFAECSEKNNIPRQGLLKACVTSDYVDMVYNSFVDVSDCLDLPQKVMLPKFLNESGFHLNAFGAFRVYDEKNNTMRNLFDLRVCNPKDKKISSLGVLKIANKDGTLRDLPKNRADEQKSDERVVEDIQLMACTPDQKKAFFEKEDALLAKLKDETVKDKTEITDELKSLRQSQTTLREIFDFKKADDSFYRVLTTLATKPGAYCNKYLVERFCDNDLKIVGGDTGIGQFTEAAANEAKNLSDKTFAEIRKSNKPSCQRISQIPGVFDSVVSGIDKRCNFIKSPPNPVSALIHYGSMLRGQRKNVENLWKANKPERWNGKDIDDLMAEAGIENFDKDKIKETLAVLAYNAGPEKPIVLFGNWLQSRMKSLKEHPIEREDLDFKVPIQDEFKKMTSETANKMKANFESLSSLKNPTPSQREELKRLQALKLDHLNFSNYIRAYHVGFAKGYLKYVRDAADVLDKTFGKGVCTPEKFLEL
jgi:hypothetical protein